MIVDCLTLWVTQLLCSNYSATQQQNEIDSFLQAVKQFDDQLSIVSNETNLGIMPTDPLSRRYGDTIGVLHQQLADEMTNVLLMVAGLPLVVK